MKKAAKLGVNIDHVATLRQARQCSYPDPVQAGAIAELAGADQITCHLRGDRRHIQDEDLPRLRDMTKTQLNVEIAATEEMLSIVSDCLAKHPGQHRVTLVPEREGEVTTEGGLDACGRHAEITQAVQRLVEARISVSLFIDPVPAQIEASALPGVDMIELNTASYAEASAEEIEIELVRLKKATYLANKMGLEVAAGHGLTHLNLPGLVKEIPEIIEYNIGHSIVSRAVFIGLEQAIEELVSIIRK
jgi:pyridoxine 5-phosphate synthase